MFRHLFSIVSKQQQCIKCESSHFQPGEALEGAFSVIMNLRMERFEAIVVAGVFPHHTTLGCGDKYFISVFAFLWHFVHIPGRQQQLILINSVVHKNVYLPC